MVLTPVEVHLKDTAVCKGEMATLNVQNMAVDSLKYIWHDGSTTPQYKASKSEKISVPSTNPSDVTHEGEHFRKYWKLKAKMRITFKTFPLLPKASLRKGDNVKPAPNIANGFHEFITIFRVLIGNAKFLTKFVQF